MIEVIIFSLLGGVVSLIGGIFLLRKEYSAKSLARYATPFAAGALLAAVFLDLFPEGVEESDNVESVFYAALAGIVLFFFAERFLRWFHHHDQHDEPDSAHDATKSLIIIGDIIHNALDGVTIAAAFLVSVPTGIITTIAVAAHEIPQEIGDFGLLLSRGMRRKNVLVVNIASALATTLAAVITYALGSSQHLPVGVLLGLSAGLLLYIAMSDVIPEIHSHTDRPKSQLLDVQPLLFLFGIVAVAASILLSHAYIG